MSGYVVSVRDLSVSIGRTKIIEKIGFELKKGEILLVAGPIGSGKTTLLKVVAGLIPTLYNNYVVEGYVEVMRLKPSEALRRGYIAYVPQNPRLFFLGRRVWEELAYIGLNNCNVYEILCDKLSIKSLLSKPITWLSDGELYRVLTTIAILSDTKLLILDEPTSHVDEEYLASILEYLVELRDRGSSIIIVDHRVEMLSKFVDKILFLKEYDKTDSYTGAQNRLVSRKGDIVLDVTDLAIGYDRKLVDNITFSVRRGEIVSVLGPNGSGKSTLLKTILGKTKPFHGTISLKGDVFYIPQWPLYWFSTESVREELLLYSKIYNRDRDYLNDIIDQFELGGLLDKNPYSLSIGEARLLSLALATIAKPDLLIIDEPLLGLDNKTMKEIIEHIIGLDNSISVLIASHNKIVREFSTRTHLIKNNVFVRDEN